MSDGELVELLEAAVAELRRRRGTRRRADEVLEQLAGGRRRRHAVERPPLAAVRHVGRGG
jgi:hypothetical protein